LFFFFFLVLLLVLFFLFFFFFCFFLWGVFFFLCFFFFSVRKTLFYLIEHFSYDLFLISLPEPPFWVWLNFYTGSRPFYPVLATKCLALQPGGIPLLVDNRVVSFENGPPLSRIDCEFLNPLPSTPLVFVKFLIESNRSGRDLPFLETPSLVYYQSGPRGIRRTCI